MVNSLKQPLNDQEYYEALQQARKDANKPEYSDSQIKNQHYDRWTKQQAENLKSARPFFQSNVANVKQESIKTREFGGIKNRSDIFRRSIGRQKKRISSLNYVKMGKAAATAFTEIRVDVFNGVHILVIGISVLADIFTLFPLFGSVMAIFFSVIIWVIYAVSGHLRNRASAKVLASFVLMFLEFIPIINALPFFTISALANYYLALVIRKANREN